MPKITGCAKRLRIYIGEDDRWDGEPLYNAIVRKAKELDLAGATVFRGLVGFGAHSRIHTSTFLLSGDLPILVETIDSEEYINKILPYLDQMVKEGLVTIDDIEIVKYGKSVRSR